MAVNVETLEKLERRITLTLPVDSINSEVESRLKKLSRTVKAAGFRPGKVPMSVVTQRYGYSVHYEVMNDRVGQAFTSATTEAKLRVAGAPRITQKEEAPRRPVGIRRHFRGLPGCEARRSLRCRGRARPHRGDRGRGRQDPGHPAQATPHLRAAPDGRSRRGQRSRDDRLRRQDRRRGVRGGQGRGFPVHPRRGPDARGLREGCARHEDRGIEDLPAAVPRRLSGQGRRGQGGRFPSHLEEGRGAAPAGGERGARQGARRQGRLGRRAASRHPQEPGSGGQVPRSRAQQGRGDGCIDQGGRARRAEGAHRRRSRAHGRKPRAPI